MCPVGTAVLVASSSSRLLPGSNPTLSSEPSLRSASLLTLSPSATHRRRAGRTTTAAAPLHHRMSAEQTQQPQQQQGPEDVLTKEAVDAFVKKLDEDDEFEDFPEEEWEQIQAQTGTGEMKLWEENWEDQDEYKDDFTKKLQAELAKHEGTKTQ